MSNSTPHPAVILPIVQQYAWGKLESDSLVFSLAQSATPALFPRQTHTTAPKQPYAELWMGTHPSGPSKIITTLNHDTYTSHQVHSLVQQTTTSSQLTSESIIQMPTLKEHLNGADLPFLFKVLSINEALSIQSHPDKTLAAQLHQSHPDLYKDPNHKPELVVALTYMRVLRGFRHISQIIELFRELTIFFNGLISPILTKEFHLPSLNTITPSDISSLSYETQQALLKALWSALHTFNQSNPTAVATVISTFQHRYSHLAGVYQSTLNSPLTTDLNDITTILPLIYQLSTLYPTDLAIFSPLFLHYFSLNPGESTFLGPNIPHAYLYGDCIEIMACSDNVIRAGLTPKYRDFPTLLSSLTYEMTPRPHISNGIIINDDSHIVRITLYQPPQHFSEFALIHTQIEQSMQTPTSQPDQLLISLPKLPTDSIILIKDGFLNLLITCPSPSDDNINITDNNTNITVTPIDELENYHAQSLPCSATPGAVLFIPKNSDVMVMTSSQCSIFQALQNTPMQTLVELNDYDCDVDVDGGVDGAVDSQ